MYQHGGNYMCLCGLVQSGTFQLEMERVQAVVKQQRLDLI